MGNTIGRICTCATGVVSSCVGTEILESAYRRSSFFDLALSFMAYWYAVQCFSMSLSPEMQQFLEFLERYRSRRRPSQPEEQIQNSEGDQQQNADDQIPPQQSTVGGLSQQLLNYLLQHLNIPFLQMLLIIGLIPMINEDNPQQHQVPNLQQLVINALPADQNPGNPPQQDEDLPQQHAGNGMHADNQQHADDEGNIPPFIAQENLQLNIDIPEHIVPVENLLQAIFNGNNQQQLNGNNHWHENNLPLEDNEPPEDDEPPPPIVPPDHPGVRLPNLVQNIPINPLPRVAPPQNLPPPQNIPRWRYGVHGMFRPLQNNRIPRPPQQLNGHAPAQPFRQNLPPAQNMPLHNPNWDIRLPPNHPVLRWLANHNGGPMRMALNRLLNPQNFPPPQNFPQWRPAPLQMDQQLQNPRGLLPPNQQNGHIPAQPVRQILPPPQNLPPQQNNPPPQNLPPQQNEPPPQDLSPQQNQPPY